MDRVFDVKAWPFLIKVKDVQGRTMIGPTFKKRAEKREPVRSCPGRPTPTSRGLLT